MQACTKTAPQARKSHPRRLTKAAMLAQAETGMRFCLACNKLLPPENFRSNGTRAHTCMMHIRDEKKRYIIGTNGKKSIFDSMRTRAHHDIFTLGQTHVHISRQQVMDILSEKQMANYTKYCLLPLHPDKTFSSENVVVVTTVQRGYLLKRWEHSKNVQEYHNDLKLLLGDQLVGL
jgi:hypothetical protein